MNERRYNALVLSADYYRTKEEYYTAIGRTISILQENDYVIEIPRRECDITIIHYNCGDPQMGTPLPVWLTPEEEETIIYED